MTTATAYSTLPGVVAAGSFGDGGGLKAMTPCPIPCASVEMPVPTIFANTAGKEALSVGSTIGIRRHAMPTSTSA